MTEHCEKLWTYFSRIYWIFINVFKLSILYFIRLTLSIFENRNFNYIWKVLECYFKSSNLIMIIMYFNYFRFKLLQQTNYNVGRLFYFNILTCIIYFVGNGTFHSSKAAQPYTITAFWTQYNAYTFIIIQINLFKIIFDKLYINVK